MARLDYDAEARIAARKAATTPFKSDREKDAELAVSDAKIQEEINYATKIVGTTGKTQAQLDAAKQASEVATLTKQVVDPTTGYVSDPLKVKAIQPKAPAGYHYTWIGGVKDGKWTLYKDAPVAGAGGNGNGSGNGTGITSTVPITLVSTEIDEYGNTIGFYSDGSKKTLIESGRKYKSTVDENAYAILKSTFAEYGLDDPDILKEIEGYMERGLGSEQAGLELRKTKAYTTRFKGNEIRRAAGLNVVSEAEYLTLENSYNETLRAFGAQGFFGTDRKVAQQKMAEIIGNDISATEFKDRIDTVVTRVNNSDPSIKKTLKTFYNIGDEDLIQYFLSPKDNLPKLQEKVTAAEIGSAALGQGLITDVARATALAKFGVDRKEALKGYSQIGAVLPTATKLGDIYKEEDIKYTQQTGEEEVFQELESARRKRLRLAEKEVGSFSGSSGVGQTALKSQNRGIL